MSNGGTFPARHRLVQAEISTKAKMHLFSRRKRAGTSRRVRNPAENCGAKSNPLAGHFFRVIRPAEGIGVDLYASLSYYVLPQSGEEIRAAMLAVRLP